MAYHAAQLLQLLLVLFEIHQPQADSASGTTVDHLPDAGEHPEILVTSRSSSPEVMGDARERAPQRYLFLDREEPVDV